MAVAFLLVVLVITRELFAGSNDVSGLEMLLALAGFILASSGLRDMMGLSRVESASLFELAFLVLPMAILSVGILYALVRRKKRNAPKLSLLRNGCFGRAFRFILTIAVLLRVP
ncbi:hypothetical protein JYT20_00185 [Rhodothermus sp. AH-315-K08]|nr:hypothetical protein [Rhodothermus sp. AH-315-K08]